MPRSSKACEGSPFGLESHYIAVWRFGACCVFACTKIVFAASGKNSMKRANSDQTAMKQKLVREIRRLLLIAAYLACFFLVFRLYTHLILADYGINYFEYGLTLIKALVLAKIILTAEALHIGEKFRGQPLIVPTIYNTLAFASFTLVFELL